MTKIPNVIPSRSGDHILVIVPNHWGRGVDIKEAKAKVQRQAGRVSKQWVVYSVHPEAYLDDLGYIRAPGNHEPIELAKSA